MRRLPILAVFALLALPALARADVAGAERIWQLMSMDAVIGVMRDEGLNYGRDLDAEMLDGKGGQGFARSVRAIYDTPQAEAATRAAFIAELAGADTTPIVAFFEAPLGQRIVGLELSARRALMDDDVEQAARDSALELGRDGDPRATQIERFIEVNDLIDENVAGTMNSSLAFAQGMNADGSVSEDDMLASVAGDEDQIRQETEDWLMAFVGLAYQPLGNDEFQAYIDFSATPEGQALNNAIFRAFDPLMTESSRQMGAAVARAMLGEDL